jgi:hypothetical protein
MNLLLIGVLNEGYLKRIDGPFGELEIELIFNKANINEVFRGGAVRGGWLY